MKYSRISLLAFLVVVGQLSAGEPAADFSISASVAPGDVMPPGTEGVVTITLIWIASQLFVPKGFFLAQILSNPGGFMGCDATHGV